MIFFMRWHKLLLFIVGFGLLWGIIMPVQAAIITPSDDAAVVSSAPNNNFGTATTLGVRGENLGSCSSTIETYLKFDISSVTQEIDSAVLTLRSTNSSNTGNLTMELRGAVGSAQDGWDEGTVTWNSPKPTLDATSLGTASLTVAGSDVVFNSTPALASFLETERTGDGIATLGIIAFSCNAASVSQDMASKEHSTAPAPQLEVSPPLAVSLASFTATSQPDHVLVDWATVFEQDNLGFNLLRSTSAEGEQMSINSELIPSQAPGSGQGASYAFEDSDVEDGTTYYYWLEDVDTAGITTRHGPVSVVYESAPTAVDVSTLGAVSDSRWANGLLGSLLLAAAGVVWYRRRRV